MDYKFNIGGKITEVWMWNDDFHNTVDVRDEEKSRSFTRSIREDKNGEKFFTWNKERVYLKDYIKISMKELKEKIENGEEIFNWDLLTQAILNDGVENVRFMCKLARTTHFLPGIVICDLHDTAEVLCKITERRYKVKDNYKIQLTPVENEDFGNEDFYVSDMFSLIKSGDIKIVV